MINISEQITKIEEEIKKTPYHKGTEHYIGKLRAKLSKLKDKQINTLSKKKGGGVGYSVKKQGDATVTLVGEPSVGKSSLLNKLTNAKSKIAPYSFTTVSVIPGMMDYKDSKIQILDVPGLIEGAEIGKGRGKEVISVVRGSDLLIILCDVGNEKSFDTISSSLKNSGMRTNEEPPGVKIIKKLKGGLIIHSNIKQDFSNETVKKIAQEFGINNAEIKLTQKLTLDLLIDAFSRNRVYIPAIYVVNKIDLVRKKGKANKYLYISVENNINIDKLRNLIWDKLDLVRVYLVKPNEKPTFKNPIIMKENDTLSDVSAKIGTEFAEDRKKAKVWGPSAKFPGQEVSLLTKVKEGMQIRFI